VTHAIDRVSSMLAAVHAADDVTRGDL
jgi:hypothetical protein